MKVQNNVKAEVKETTASTNGAYLTGDMARLTGYTERSLYNCEKRGVVTPRRTANGVRIWSDADYEAIMAYKVAQAPKRHAMLIAMARKARGLCD